MKALLSRQTGGPETLELADLAEPTPGKGQLLVRVKACAINYPDVLIIEDKYQFKPQRPLLQLRHSSRGATPHRSEKKK